MAEHDDQKVYVMQHELGPVKIGIAKYPKRRLSNIQISCPFEITLRNTANPTDAREAEQYLHDTFDKYHIRGEWFDLPPELRDFEIPSHIDEYGQPDIEVENTLPDPDMNFYWAKTLDRLVIAIKKWKWVTPEIRGLRSEWQEIGGLKNSQECRRKKQSPLLEEFGEEQTPAGKVICSHCGHHYDRAESGCPTCGDSSAVDEHERGHW